MSKLGKYNEDIRNYTPKVGGTDVKDTESLSGQSGGLTPAQNETNTTEPWTTGKAVKPGNLGAETVH